MWKIVAHTGCRAVNKAAVTLILKFQPDVLLSVTSEGRCSRRWEWEKKPGGHSSVTHWKDHLYSTWFPERHQVSKVTNNDKTTILHCKGCILQSFGEAREVTTTLAISSADLGSWGPSDHLSFVAYFTDETLWSREGK